MRPLDPWRWRLWRAGAARLRPIAGAILLLAAAACAGPEMSYQEWVLEELTEMAWDGDAGAQAALGQVYEKGSGTERDPDAALRWYRRASERGDPDAPFYMGSLYERGLGIERDFAAAARWYRVAALRGNVAAQASLAYLYERGLGVKQDYGEAVRWYAEASDAWRLMGEYPAEAAFATGRERVRYGDPPEMEEVRGGEESAAGEAEASSAGERAPSAPEGEEGAAIEEPRPSSSDAEKSALLSPQEAPDPSQGSSVEAPPPLTVHLASFRTEASAIREWERLGRLHGGLLDGLEPTLASVDLGEEGVFVRLLAGPFEDPRAADALCSALKLRDQYCVVMAP